MQKLVLTSTELADVLGVTPQTLPRRVQAGLLPVRATGTTGWDVGMVIKHLYGLAADKRKGASDSAADRYRVARAKKAELEVGRMEGALISRDDAERALTQVITEAKQQLLNISHLLAAAVPPEFQGHVEELTDTQVRLVLRALAEGKLRVAPAEPVATETDGQTADHS